MCVNYVNNFFEIMKSLLLLFCYLLFISNSLVLAQNDGQCTIEGIDDSQYNSLKRIDITDTQIDTNLFAALYEGTLDVTSCTGDNYSYFAVTSNETHFNIDSTTAFADFDKNTPKTDQTLQLVNFICIFQCTSGQSSLSIQIQVTDTNNHAPEFNRDTYEFKVPTPIMPVTDFTIYGDPIVATDIDFSNQNIIYTIEPNDFAITTEGTTTSKDYTALFSASAIIQLTGNKTYSLTATDTGTPPLSTTTTLIITIDESQSLDSPSFEGLSYSFNYTSETNSLIANDGPITLVTNKPNSVSDPELIGELSEYFKATFDASSSTIELEVADPLPVTTQSFTIVTIGVSTDNRASTSVIVYLPAEINEAPQFSNHYYTGTYDDVTNEVSLDDIINVISTRTPEVNISGEYADHFSVIYDEKTTSCQISVKNKLTAEELKDHSYTTIVIKASVDEQYDTAAIVLSLSQHVLQFTEVLYSASYNIDNTVTVDEGNPISFTTDVTGVTIAPDDTHSKNFGVSQDSEKNQYGITVVEPLTGDVLKEGKDIELTLTASDAYGNQAQTVVTIHLPSETKTDSPAFSETVYVADYTPDSKAPNVVVEKYIVINNRNDQSLIKITLDSYTENFDIIYTDNKWALTLKEALTGDILTSKSEIVITLTATEENNDSTGQAILIINWKKSPQFSQEYYKGAYPEIGTGSIELEEAIGFANVENPENVKISLKSYSENFEITYSSSKWIVTITNKLNDSILSSTELVIVLSATEADNINEGHSILILELPTTDTVGPKFEEAYYVAKYPESGTGSIEFEKPIKLMYIDDPTAVTINLDNYTDNFEIVYESNIWKMNVIQSLKEDVLTNNVELIMTLTASTTENDDICEGVLVLNLPLSDNEAGPEFSEAYYIAQYPVSGSGMIEFQTPIEFTNVDDMQSLSITLDNYTTYFEVKYSDRWYINILESLDGSILKKNVELVALLIAKEEGSDQIGEATLVLQLPTSETISEPKFSEAFYIAEYPESSTGLIEFEPPITLENVEDPTKVTISLNKYAENFEIEYESNKWTINVIQGLNDSVLNGNIELLMTLIVKDELGNEGQSALVLKLPTAANESALQFSETYYLADYPKDTTSIIEFESPVEFLNVEDITNVNIRLDKYSDNFKIVYDENRWYIQIISNLDEDILQKNTELVMALIATESGNKNEGEATLVLRLPSVVANEAPIFSDAYYLAKYPEEGDGLIEFLSPLKITNVADQNSITISLDTYADNFEVKYDSDRWYINITNSLKDAILHKNPEIVMTLVATEAGNPVTGESALVLQLPVATNDSAPLFSEAYYLAEYTEDGTGIIEFTNPIDFTNVDDATSVTITLDKYSDKLEVIYDSGRWLINIKDPLDSNTIEENTELLITLAATKPEYRSEGFSVLVLKLPSGDSTTGLKFSKLYYTASYPKKGKGIIDFDNPIEFVNVGDQSSLNISLDNYTENFDITYDGIRWFLYVKISLEESVLKENSELVITMTVTESGKSDKGYSVLVLKLPGTTEIRPEFSEAYYLADYPEAGIGTIEFENPITFLNVDDPSSINITLDKYSENFVIKYDDSEKWLINIEHSLDNSTLNENTEIVMTLAATETDNPNIGYSVLVLKLPKTVVDAAPKFSKAFYVGKYPQNDETTVELDTEISFLNVDDPATVSITMDNYSTYFEITYTSNQWILTVKNPLDSEILNNNKELVLAITATVAGNANEGYSALVIELPVDEIQAGPVFSEAYYLADYPEKYTGTIEFQSPITFENVEDLSKVTIKLENFTEYFDIKLDNDIWLINVKKNLDDAILEGTSELVTTLIASDTDMSTEGYSAFVLRIPIKEELPPIFSQAYYEAEYTFVEGEASIIFTNPIDVTNKEDITSLSISVDNYKENLNITYNSETKSWDMKVISPLADDILLAKTDLVVALTATNLDNALTDHASIDLSLPYLNTDKAPKFTKTYYTAKYTITGETALVKFDNPLNISNAENPQDITINLDNYINYFKILYDADSNSWQMNVIKNLDQAILNSKLDLVMGLTSVEKENDQYGEAALVMRLPIVNNDESPKFSSIYYQGTYTPGDTVAVELEDNIEIVNKDDLSTITISIDDSYKDNFEIHYAEDTSQWVLNVKSPLSEDVFKDNSDLILTLTSIENGNNNIGQSALVLHLPSETTKLAPTFNLAHYTANYLIENYKATIVLNDNITVVNKADLGSISMALDSYETYFEMEFDSSENLWGISVFNPLPEDILNSTRELVLTLIATETDNENEGKSTLIVTLPPSSSSDDIVEFSQIHYSANYTSEENGGIVMNDKIMVTTKDSTDNVAVSIEGEYADYFSINPEGDSYVVTVKTSLPLDILGSETTLILTLEAAVDDVKSFATLVINLPITVVDSIRFSEALYTASYQIVDGKGSFNVNGTIEVQTEEEDTNVEYKISSSTGYESYFNITYSDKVVTVTLAEDEIPTEVLRNNPFIPLILTVGISGTTASSSSVLNVEINYDEEEQNIEFSNVLYDGKYEVINGTATITINDPITIVTDEIDDNVEVSITNEYETYFSISYSNNLVTIDTSNTVPADVLTGRSVISLTLQATIKETTYISSAVLNLEIKYDDEDDTDFIDFASVLYTGDYSVVDGEGQLNINDAINVITTRPDTDIEPTISDDSDYKEYFSVVYANKVVTVELSDNLPTEVIERISFIPLTLIVTIKDTALTSSAVLNINIDGVQNVRSISFSNVLYGGTYEVTDGTGALTNTDTISIVTEEPDSNINVSITNEYANFFNVEYSNKNVEVTLKEQLTDTTLNSSSVIPLTLQAEITGTQAQSLAVLNIAVKYDSEGDTDSIEFGSVLYTGQYSVSDGSGKLELNELIQVITTINQDELIEPSVSNDSEYRDYFTVSYSSNVVSILLKENLPDEAIERNSFITLTLVIGIKDTVHTSSAVLNIEIKRDDNEDERSIAFSNVLYTGNYEVTDGVPTLTIDGNISVVTDESDSDVDITVTNEYATYFSVEYSEKIVTIKIKQPLTEETLTSFSFVPLTLQAEITGTSYNTSAVVNIQIKYDSGDDTDSIQFASVLYTGEYTVDNGQGKLAIDDSIKIITNTDRPDSDIEAKIVEDSEYRDYFTVSYSSNVVSILLKENLPSEAVERNSFIALPLMVGIKDTVHTSSAVLNINIKSDGNEDERSIAFSNVLYTGKYEVTDGVPTLTIDGDISVVTDESDSDVDITITNEYATYFSVEYSEKIVTIKIKQPLTEETLTSFSFVPLTLQAEITGTSYNTSAVTNIELKYDSGNDTDSIQFTSVLYTGEYTVDNGQGTLEIDDSIKIITNRPDSDIEANIVEGSLYRDYFSISYSKNTVTIQLLKMLPSDVVKSNSFLPLTLEVAIKETVHSSMAVLNIEIDNEDNSDDDSSSKTDLQHLRITFIVVTAVLSVLLLVCIAAAVAFYFLRIRSGSYENLEEDGSGRVRFGKHSLNRSPSAKSSALEERRPTGFIFQPINEDILDNTNSSTDGDKGRRKSVAFDDNVEKLQIDSVNDDDTDIYSSDNAQVTHV